MLKRALNGEGVLVRVDAVPNGLACGCRCPACGERLVAKNGGYVVEHHFAHESGKECEWAEETALHHLAKKIYREAGFVMLPGNSVWVFDDFREVTVPPGRLPVASAGLEARFGGVVPDVSLETKHGERLFVEIYVTHKVDEEKRRKIIAGGVPTFEVDLSKVGRDISEDDLKRLLLTDDAAAVSKWIFTNAGPKVEAMATRFLERIPVKKVRYRAGDYNGGAEDPDERRTSFVVDCPRSKRRKRGGGGCANVDIECDKCRFAWSIENERLMCGGKSFVGDYEDMFLPLEERKERYYAARHTCVYCGEPDMTVRAGKHT